MTPLLLSLLCAAPPAPVEAPRPSAEPIRVSVRVSEQGQVVFAPTVITTSGQTAQVATAERSVQITPTRQPDGRIRAEVRVAESRPDGTGRTDRRMTMAALIHSGDTIALDWNGPAAGNAHITIEQPGKPTTVVPLRPSR